MTPKLRLVTYEDVVGSMGALIADAEAQGDPDDALIYRTAMLLARRRRIDLEQERQQQQRKAA